MPRFRQKGSSGDFLSAETVKGYQEGGGRLVRATFNAEAVDPRGIDNKGNSLPGNAFTASSPTHDLKGDKSKQFGGPYKSGETVTLRSLAQTRNELLSDLTKASQAQSPSALKSRKVQHANAEAEYVRFQDKLRQIDGTEAGIQQVFESFATSARVLSHSRSQAGPATLTWLGSEFAENLLTRVYAGNPNLSQESLALETKVSEWFAKEAISLLKAGHLTPKGFEVFMAGFAAGMRGISNGGDSKHSTNLHLRFADANFGDSAQAALYEALESLARADKFKATVDSCQAGLEFAGEVATLPDLVKKLLNPGRGPGQKPVADQGGLRATPSNTGGPSGPLTASAPRSSPKQNTERQDSTAQVAPANRPSAESAQSSRQNLDRQAHRDAIRSANEKYNEKTMAALERIETQISKLNAQIAKILKHLEEHWRQLAASTQLPAESRSGSSAKPVQATEGVAPLESLVDHCTKLLQTISAQISHLSEQPRGQDSNGSSIAQQEKIATLEVQAKSLESELAQIRQRIHSSASLSVTVADDAFQKPPPAVVTETKQHAPSNQNTQAAISSREGGDDPDQERSTPAATGILRTAITGEPTEHLQTPESVLLQAAQQPMTSSAVASLFKGVTATGPSTQTPASRPSPEDGKATSSTPRTSPPDRASTASRKRQQPDTPSDDTDRERAGHHERTMQARAITEANDEQPAPPEQLAAQPAMGQIDPGAAPAHAGPMPGEQLQAIPVNEPPPVAPQAGANPVNENDPPAEQLPAAATHAGSGLTLPRHPADTPRPGENDATVRQAQEELTRQPKTVELNPQNSSTAPELEALTESPAIDDDLTTTRPIITVPADTTISTSNQSLIEEDPVVFLSTDEVAAALNKPTTPKRTRETERVFPDSWSVADDNRLREGEAPEHVTTPQTLAASSKDPDASRPQPTNRGGNNPRPITDGSDTPNGISKEGGLQPPHEPHHQPTSQPADQSAPRAQPAAAKGPVQARTVPDSLLHAARDLAFELIDEKDIKLETLQQAVAKLMTHRTAVEAGLRDTLERVIADPDMDAAARRGEWAQWRKTTADLEPALFNETFRWVGRVGSERLRVVSRLITLSEATRGPDANENVARFASQLLAYLDTHSNDRRDSLYAWRPQLQQARQAAESQKKSRPSQGNLDHLLRAAHELTDAATDRGLEFADGINRRRKPITERAMRSALVALAGSELEQEHEFLSKLMPADAASRSALVERLKAFHAQAQQALFTSILTNLSKSQPARDDFSRHLLATRAYALYARLDESDFIDQLYLALIQHATSEEQENADGGWSKALAKARRGAADPGHGAGSKDAGSPTRTQAPRDLKGQVTDGGEEDDFETPAVEAEETGEVDETDEADGADEAGEIPEPAPGIVEGEAIPQEPASSLLTGTQLLDRPAVDLSTVVQSIRLKDRARAELATLLAPTGMGLPTADWSNLLEEVVRLMDLAGPQVATSSIADDGPSATGMAPISWEDVGRMLGQRPQLQEAARSVDFLPHTTLLVAAMESVGNAADRAACMKGLVGTVADTGLAVLAAAIFTAAEMTRARAADPTAFRSLCEALLERSQSVRLAPDSQATLSDIQAILRETIEALAPVKDTNTAEPSLSEIHAAREALARARSDLEGLLSAPAPSPRDANWSEHMEGIGRAMARIEDGWGAIPAELRDMGGATRGRTASWHGIGLNLRGKLNLQADRSGSATDDVQHALSAVVERLVDAKALAECVSGMVAQAHPENLRMIARKALLTAQELRREPHIATFVGAVFESLKAQIDASAQDGVPAETIRLRRDVIADAINKAQESAPSQSSAAALFRIAHSSFAPAVTKRAGDGKHEPSTHS